MSSQASSWFRVFLAYKLVVFGLALVGLGVVAHITPDSLSHFIALLYQWDAKHILRVASEGYLAAEPSIQVFPLFPLLVRAFHLLPGSWESAAFIVAQLASAGAFYFFYRLARTELSRQQATIALVAFAAFPTAYFLSLSYTEGLYCACSFAAVYFLRIESYGPAAVAAGASMLTRMNGLFFLPALAAHAWVNRQSLSRRQARGLALVAAAIAASFGAYLAMNQLLFGNPFYFLSLQGKVWGVHVSWPFSGAWHALGAWDTRSPEERISIIALELAFTLLAVAHVPKLARRDRIFDLTYVGLNLLLLVSLDFWLSRPRYVLIFYTLFIGLGRWLEHSTVRLSLALLASAGLFGIYFTLYLNAQWAH